MRSSTSGCMLRLVAVLLPWGLSWGFSWGAMQGGAQSPPAHKAPGPVASRYALDLASLEAAQYRLQLDEVTWDQHTTQEEVQASVQPVLAALPSAISALNDGPWPSPLRSDIRRCVAELNGSIRSALEDLEHSSSTNLQRTYLRYTEELENLRVALLPVRLKLGLPAE